MLAVEQNERLTIVLRNAFEGLPQNRLLLAVDRPLGWQRLGGGGIRQLIKGFGALRWHPKTPAEFAVEGIARDSAEPGFQVSRLTQLPKLFPGAQKDLLADVLAAGDAAGGTVRHGADERLIPPYDPAKGLAPPRQALGDQIRIGSLG